MLAAYSNPASRAVTLNRVCRSDVRLDLTQGPTVRRGRFGRLFLSRQYVDRLVDRPELRRLHDFRAKKERQPRDVIGHSADVLVRSCWANWSRRLHAPGVVDYRVAGRHSVLLPAARGSQCLRSRRSVLGLFVSVILFGAIGVFCSSYFFSHGVNSVRWFELFESSLPLVIGWGGCCGNRSPQDGLLRLKVIRVCGARVRDRGLVILMTAGDGEPGCCTPDVGQRGARENHLI